MAVITKNFVSDYAAPTDGVSTASLAVDAWIADAQAIIAGGDTPKLLMGGFTYHLPGTNGLSNTLRNAIIDGEGASVDALFIGNAGTIRESFAYSARIASVAVGAISATIIQGPYPNDVQTTAGFLSVGQWIMICGVSMQGGSYPPNFQWNEFRKITGIAGNVISWSGPLVYPYLQTWPLCDTVAVTVTSGTPAVVTMAKHGFLANQRLHFSHDVGGSVPAGVTRFAFYYVLAAGLTVNSFRFSASPGGVAVNTTSTGSSVILHTQDMDLAGPATIYGLLPTFDGEHRYSNLTNTSSGATFGGGSASILLDNVDFTGLGACPSSAKSWVHRDSQIGTQNEIDKCVEYLAYENCTGTGIEQLLFQSPGLMQVLITGCTLKTMNGTPLNLTAIDSTFTEIFIAGAVFYGRSNSITLNNVTLAASRVGGANVELAVFSGWSFAGGVFSIPLTWGAAKGEALRCLVPGFKYVVGYYDGSRHISPDAGDEVIFTLLASYQDATTLYFATDLASASFPTYLGGNAANRFFSYGGKTITQTASGPADITQFEEPFSDVFFVDDNGTTCFVDDNGVTCWFDDDGITLCCGPGRTKQVVYINFVSA